MGRRCYRRPKDVPLDRVLFETAYACGTRAAEACGLYVEDLDPRTDDEHVRIRGPVVLGKFPTDMPDLPSESV
jgi:integrase/recombinase XerC/integrase/recombinase XerD